MQLLAEPLCAASHLALVPIAAASRAAALVIRHHIVGAGRGGVERLGQTDHQRQLLCQGAGVKAVRDGQTLQPQSV